MSSDDPNEAGTGDTPPPPQGQGRWLGAVRSWIGGTEDEGAAEGVGLGEGAAENASDSQTLSADEIRRRRLAKMGAPMSQQQQQEGQVMFRPV